MTCIVGLVHGSEVWIGGDSAATGGHVETVARKDVKVFYNDHYLFGVCGSYRVAQLLQWRFVPPQPDRLGERLESFLTTTWMEALRECLKDNLREADDSWCFLLGYDGRLFYVEHTWQVGEAHDPWFAIGAGAQVAVGSLYTSQQNPEPKVRIESALAAAAHHCTGVRGPWVVECVKAELPF